MDTFQASRPTASIADFLRVEATDPDGRARDRAAGARIFFRLDDEARMRLLSELIAAWLDQAPLNEAMVGSVLRDAWDSEPCRDGRREGSYVSSVAVMAPGGAIWSIGDLAKAWGAQMMSPDEVGQLEALSFPMTVYRGGTGSVDDVASGVSWSASQETARFYAETWPRRRGDTASR